MFFYFCKVLFSGFFQFNGNFVDGQNNSKYRDSAPLNLYSISSDLNERSIPHYRPLKFIHGLNKWTRLIIIGFHLHKHVRRVTDLPMFMRKKIVPCNQITIPNQSENMYAISDQIHGQNLCSFLDQNHSKPYFVGPQIPICKVPPPPYHGGKGFHVCFTCQLTDELMEIDLSNDSQAI